MSGKALAAGSVIPTQLDRQHSSPNPEISFSSVRMNHRSQSQNWPWPDNHLHPFRAPKTQRNRHAISSDAKISTQANLAIIHVKTLQNACNPELSDDSSLQNQWRIDKVLCPCGFRVLWFSRRGTTGSHRKAEKTKGIIRGVHSLSRPPTFTLRACCVTRPRSSRCIQSWQSRPSAKTSNLLHASYRDRRAEQYRLCPRCSSPWFRCWPVSPLLASIRLQFRTTMPTEVGTANSIKNPQAEFACRKHYRTLTSL